MGWEQMRANKPKFTSKYLKKRSKARKEGQIKTLEEGIYELKEETRWRREEEIEKYHPLR